MKKNIFLLFLSIIFIFVLFYFYDEKEEVVNKEYNDYENNVFISYPYFGNEIIDSYLSDSLNDIISAKDILSDMLFIDYDYVEKDSLIELILYIYEEKENTVINYSRKIVLDLVSSTILENNKVIDVDYEYDIYNEIKLDKDKPMIALTFDDGPNHNTSVVLDILEKYNCKATFFVLGSNIVGNEKILAKMKDLGMEIGSHMYSHKLITKLDDNEIKEEIKKVDDLIFNITGEYPSLIRPSYGTINKRVKMLIDRPIILWNIDTLDWKYHNSKTIAKKVISKVSDGDIILMHDIYRATANSLDIIIPSLLEKGYQFVTVSELLYYKEMKISSGVVYNGIK